MSYQPLRAQKAMIFVDGTNLFYRLDAAQLNLTASFNQMFWNSLGRRHIQRVYLYTIQHHYDRAKTFHGVNIEHNVRVVFGEGIPTGDGNIREKGVDDLLVADLVYHAAQKNLDYALVISTDTDFVQALKRVEDFGCKTGIAAICAEVPDRLKNACDDPLSISAEDMLLNRWAAPRPENHS
jgi:uncharacterized LabA/DUF88 family protein